MSENTTLEINKRELWEKILGSIYTFIDKGHLLTIFVNSAVLNYHQGVLTIGFASIIGPEYVREKYHSKIFPVIKELLPECQEIRYEVSSALSNEDNQDKLPLELFMSVIGAVRTKAPRKVPGKQEVLLEGGMRSKILNKRYTLQNFIPGSENRLVHAACMAVGAKPAGIYNPLYIYGNVGLGKTHLLQATGHEILRNHPDMKVVYMTAEHFINKIVEAIGKKHTKPFKDEYRNLDCLIVDDIQFFANKATSEQEFFHTFNDLYDNGKQIILSADRPPRELNGLDDRLRSRFGMGMVIEVTSPSFETRLAILKSKCQEYQTIIDPEVLEFVAYNVNQSVREMVGVLITAIAEAQLEGNLPSVRSVANIIRKLNRDQDANTINLTDSKKRTVKTAEEIIDLVAAHYRLTKSDLIGEERRREIMQARQIAMYLIREMLNTSYEQIGDNFGGRNHTTVMHACGKVEEALKKELFLQEELTDLKRKLGF